ncbi:MAG: glutamate synthase subunit beta [Planctomycetota bacterium]
MTLSATNPHRAFETQSPPAADPLAMRAPSLRVNDFYEVYEKPDPARVVGEAGRCMNCGAAFCMPEGGYLANNGMAAGCPISNDIPVWNRLIETGRWRDAYEALARTNNFPEFTARVCPAPCQDACIVGINERPVGIKSVERAIIDRAFDAGWVRTRRPASTTGKRVAVVGSGPAGLAAADQLRAAGHAVTVYERSDTPGGLLAYGIPNMKLDKAVVARRIALMEAAGVRFKTGADVGGTIDPRGLRTENDALILATGSLAGRDLDLPGRDLAGVTLAMPYLEAAARHQAGRAMLPDNLDAAGKHVVVLGGGDTGADCIGTALRQEARSVVNLTRREIPPDARDGLHPWPGATGVYTLDYAHAEGAARHGDDPRGFGWRPTAFRPASDAGGSARVGAVEAVSAVVRQIEGSAAERPRRFPADLVILAIGFTRHDTPATFSALELTESQLTQREPEPGIFVAGDLRRGPSLVVHAIAEGRQIAQAVEASWCG